MLILICAICGGVVLLAIACYIIYRSRKSRRLAQVETGRVEKKPSIDRNSYTRKEFVMPEYSTSLEKTKSFLKPVTSPVQPDRFPEITLSDLPEGSQKLTIIHSYTSTLDDELSLIQGDFLFLVREFDDGWALGVDPRTGDQGAFPLVCVETKDKRKSTRK